MILHSTKSVETLLLLLEEVIAHKDRYLSKDVASIPYIFQILFDALLGNNDNLALRGIGAHGASTESIAALLAQARKVRLKLLPVDKFVCFEWNAWTCEPLAIEAKMASRGVGVPERVAKAKPGSQQDVWTWHLTSHPYEARRSLMHAFYRERLGAKQYANNRLLASGAAVSGRRKRQ